MIFAFSFQHETWLLIVTNWIKKTLLIIEKTEGMTDQIHVDWKRTHGLNFKWWRETQTGFVLTSITMETSLCGKLYKAKDKVERAADVEAVRISYIQLSLPGAKPTLLTFTISWQKNKIKNSSD